MSIPKIIHYTWFSGESPDKVYQKCFASWRKILPEYKLILWDKSKIIPSDFFNKMIRKEKWAFASDYCRLFALYNYGGIYLDMDVEVLKNLDPFLEYDCFIGREDKQTLGCHVIGAEKKHPFIKKCLDFYESSVRLKITNPPTMPRIVTHLALKHGLIKDDIFQSLENNFRIFPSSYFCPLHYRNRLNKNAEQYLTSYSYCIHYWQHGWSWLNDQSIIKQISNQPWLFMNFSDWKRLLFNIIVNIKNAG